MTKSRYHKISNSRLVPAALFIKTCICRYSYKHRQMQAGSITKTQLIKFLSFQPCIGLHLFTAICSDGLFK